jgi:pimeloyl-ACP methyl ester carboxylesterase
MTEETVVLIHGIWMNGIDMSLLAWRIKQQGYKVKFFRYRSVYRNPRHNALLLQELVQGIDTPVIHFVCHSLGGLVIRHYFFDSPEQKPGRVVTLGTPHRPSHCAYRLSKLIMGEWMLGKSIEDGLLGNVPPWHGTHELGSIAGDMRFGLGVIIPGLPAPNDGSVSVEETHIENMKDHVTVHASHTGLLFSPTAAKLCIGFLENGQFPAI